MTEKRLRPLVPFRLFHWVNYADKYADKCDCELCSEKNTEGGETSSGDCDGNGVNVHCNKPPFHRV